VRQLKQTARATVKDRRLNIRLSAPVLESLRARAAEEGLPYQTLIASVLHRFVTGRLVDRDSKASR
jgi:predicted DNA binding CopG/RHH family protein